MQHLILRPGPQLVMRAFRPEHDDTGSRLKDVDVTGLAHELLLELITVHAETTLADIFRLMEASPLLQEFYRRDFAEELCAEARKGVVEPPSRERASHEGIELLELYQQWGLDTSANEYSGMQRLHLHGVGHELAESGRSPAEAQLTVSAALQSLSRLACRDAGVGRPSTVDGPAMTAARCTELTHPTRSRRSCQRYRRPQADPAWLTPTRRARPGIR